VSDANFVDQEEKAGHAILRQEPPQYYLYDRLYAALSDASKKGKYESTLKAVLPSFRRSLAALLEKPKPKEKEFNDLLWQLLEKLNNAMKGKSCKGMIFELNRIPPLDGKVLWVRKYQQKGKETEDFNLVLRRNPQIKCLAADGKKLATSNKNSHTLGEGWWKYTT
jgi:hypothetical protein